MTVEALAFRAGLASATVYRAERGIGTPSDETLEALAVVLKVGVSELHTENRTYPPIAGGESAPENHEPDPSLPCDHGIGLARK